MCVESRAAEQGKWSRADSEYGVPVVENRAISAVQVRRVIVQGKSGRFDS